jgi:hypothetical protein
VVGRVLEIASSCGAEEVTARLSNFGWFDSGFTMTRAVFACRIGFNTSHSRPSLEDACPVSQEGMCIF